MVPFGIKITFSYRPNKSKYSYRGSGVQGMQAVPRSRDAVLTEAPPREAPPGESWCSFLAKRPYKIEQFHLDFFDEAELFSTRA